MALVVGNSDGGRGDDRPIVPLFEENPAAPDRHRIEPGQPRLENVIFVLVGVLTTILVFLRGLGLF